MDLSYANCKNVKQDYFTANNNGVATLNSALLSIKHLEDPHSHLYWNKDFDPKENTFYAKVVLESALGTLEIDARPSDSIALALRTNSPIFVSERIILEETVEDRTEEKKETHDFKRFIDDLKPSDFHREDK